MKKSMAGFTAGVLIAALCSPVLATEATAATVATAATAATTATVSNVGSAAPTGAHVGAQMERLDRGLVAAATAEGVFLSWRLLKSEAAGSSEKGVTGADFVVYRDGQRIAEVTDSTNYLDADGTAQSTYAVARSIEGVESPPIESITPEADNFATVPLQTPPGGTTPLGDAYTYRANDTSVGDVDGDGTYEIVVKWDPSNSKDVSHVGYTGPVLIDTYTLDGTLLNRIDLGVNVRAGAHYTQFLVYDFDGDGRSETILKTAPGTKSTSYAADGDVSAESFITLPAADLADGVAHEDDYRLSAAGFADHLEGIFQGWDSQEEVVQGQWPATIEEALGIEPRYDYPLNKADARELVDYFIDVYAPSRSSNNKLRDFVGFILDGPEYLTVFDGETGAELKTIPYVPERDDDGLRWGDYAGARIEPGNRVDRFLAGVGYLDGQHPSAVFARGYYSRTVVAAFDWNGTDLTQRWVADSGHRQLNNPFNNTSTMREGDDPVYAQLAGQGFHSLSVADVDADGKHEVVYGSATLDDDGSMLYSSYGVVPAPSPNQGDLRKLGHGDAMHVTDIDPARPGLEIFTVHENGTGAPYGYALRDAATGDVIYGEYTGRDTGRGMIGDLTSAVPGYETWATRLRAADGAEVSGRGPGTNMSIRWSADLRTQIVNGTGDSDVFIDDFEAGRVFEATGARTNNGTKGTPSLVADVFGDWREELIVRTADSSALRIYFSTEVTDHKLYTLMHDPQYRVEVARQQTAYNQPSYTGFYLASDMDFAQVPLAPSRYAMEQPSIGVSGTGVNVTWKRPAQASADLAGYAVVLTDDAGATLRAIVGADKTQARFADVAPGTWRATVVAADDVGASAPSAASASATVTGAQPVPATVSAKSMCVNGSAQVAVHVRNDTAGSIDVRVSALGEQHKRSSLPAGQAGYDLIDARTGALEAGTVDVAAYAYRAGVGYYATYASAFDAISCQ